MTAVLLTVGVVVLTVTGVDVLWTVLAAGSGAGPVTALLAVVGVGIVAGTLLSWIVVAFGVWWLIASAADGAVRVAETGQPAALLDRAYFVRAAPGPGRPAGRRRVDGRGVRPAIRRRRRSAHGHEPVLGVVTERVGLPASGRVPRLQPEGDHQRAPIRP